MASGWQQYYGCGGGGDNRAQRAAVPAQSWPPSYFHASGPQRGNPARAGFHAPWSPQESRGGRQIRDVVPKNRSESETRGPMRVGGGRQIEPPRAPAAAGAKVGLDAPASLRQWDHHVERQRQFALWHHMVKQQQQLLQQQQLHRQQLQGQKMMQVQGVAKEGHSQSNSPRVGSSPGDPPTYSEAISSRWNPNMFSDSLQHPSMVQWLRLRARETVLHRQWEGGGTRDSPVAIEGANPDDRRGHGQKSMGVPLTGHERTQKATVNFGVPPGAGRTSKDDGSPRVEGDALNKSSASGLQPQSQRGYLQPPLPRNREPFPSPVSAGSAAASAAASSAAAPRHIPPFISAAAMSTMRSTLKP